jgi:DNA-binding CsgD family transcriptional regulator
MAELPVAVMVGCRAGEEPGEPPLLRELAARPSLRHLRLAPLSDGAVAQLVRLRQPQASEVFCRTCAEATAGNPFFLEELMRTVAAERVDATDEGAAQISGLSPAAVSDSILLRLSRFPAEATALARAVAVLGETPVADAARLARLDRDAAARLAASLAASGVLLDRDPVSFPHPIVRSAVCADVAQAESGRLEWRAARLLHDQGAPVERVCAHLLAAPPAGEPAARSRACRRQRRRRFGRPLPATRDGGVAAGAGHCRASRRARPSRDCGRRSAGARPPLWTMAMLEDGERRVAVLEEAVGTLERSQTVLELLRALVDLGGALRRAGRRQDARAPLQRRSTSRRAGAPQRSASARDELLATGARPHRTALRGVAALTPGELRVGRLAGEGLLNREIAESLFLSRKTVDFHLRHVYQTLDVTRAKLAETVAAMAKD